MKRTMVLLCGLIPVFVAACSGQDSVENSVKFLQALNASDLEEAEKYTCEGEAEELAEGLRSVSPEDEANFQFTNITCQKQGGDVACNYTIVMNVEQQIEQNNDFSSADSQDVQTQVARTQQPDQESTEPAGDFDSAQESANVENRDPSDQSAAAESIGVEATEDTLIQGAEGTDEPPQPQNNSSQPQGGNQDPALQSSAEQQQVNLPTQIVFEIDDGKICGFREEVAD